MRAGSAPFWIAIRAWPTRYIPLMPLTAIVSGCASHVTADGVAGQQLHDVGVAVEQGQRAEQMGVGGAGVARGVGALGSVDVIVVGRVAGLRLHRTRDTRHEPQRCEKEVGEPEYAVHATT